MKRGKNRVFTLLFLTLLLGCSNAQTEKLKATDKSFLEQRLDSLNLKVVAYKELLKVEEAPVETVWPVAKEDLKSDLLGLSKVTEAGSLSLLMGGAIASELAGLEEKRRIQSAIDDMKVLLEGFSEDLPLNASKDDTLETLHKKITSLAKQLSETRKAIRGSRNGGEESQRVPEK